MEETLIYPFEQAPAPGAVVPVAPGVLWIRLQLPMALDHVNIYALDDGDGWFIWDTGMGDAPSQQAWRALLSGPLAGRPVRRVLVSHHHPDHVGGAGWLCRETGAELLMVKAEFLLSRMRFGGLFEETAEEDRAFYRSRGLSEGATDGLMAHGARIYPERLVRLPSAYRSVRAGEVLGIGGRDWQIRTGGGHSDEMAMLWQREDGLFLAADQVIDQITPNIGVWPLEPQARPLDDFLISLRALRAEIPQQTLVLAGHKRPFRGLATRIDQILAHHDRVFDRILTAVQDGPDTVGALVPQLFRRELPGFHAGMAFAETLAHVNTLVARGALRHAPRADGTYLLEAA